MYVSFLLKGFFDNQIQGILWLLLLKKIIRWIRKTFTAVTFILFISPEKKYTVTAKKQQSLARLLERKLWSQHKVSQNSNSPVFIKLSGISVYPFSTLFFPYPYTKPCYPIFPISAASAQFPLWKPFPINKFVLMISWWVLIIPQSWSIWIIVTYKEAFGDESCGVV